MATLLEQNYRGHFLLNKINYCYRGQWMGW